MNTELQIIKSEKFGEITADIYSDSKEMYMTAQQLGECLEYANPRESINKLTSRHEYLRESKFSVEVKLTSTDGKLYNTRVFNEDGIYEIAFLSNTEKAFEFREWVRGILKALRKGEVKLVGMTEYQRNNLNRQTERLHLQKAQLLNKMADKYSGKSEQFENVLRAYAAHELTGEMILPLPKSKEKITYSATDIGKMFDVSSQRIGKITNQHNLKTEQYGEFYHDKSRYSNKEVDTFRYYDTIIPVISEILGKDPA